MKIARVRILLALAPVLLMAACATKPTTGDHIARHGKAYEAIGKQWNKGDALLKKGERLVEKGNEQIKDGQDNVSEGEKLIKQGKRLFKESEERFATSEPPGKS